MLKCTKRTNTKTLITSAYWVNSKDNCHPLDICIDQTRRALVIVSTCYGSLEIVGVIIIIIIIIPLN